MEPIQQLLDLIGRYGLPRVISGVLIWLAVWYGPRIIRGHLTHLESSTTAAVRNADTFDRVCDTCEAIKETQSTLAQALATKLDPRGDQRYDEHIFSKVSTNEGLKQGLIGAARAIESGDPKRALPFIEKAIETLEP